MILSWDKIKLILRIISLIGVGVVLILGSLKAWQLYNEYYETHEAMALLSQDLTIATDFGKATNKKLENLNKKYAQLLREHNAEITAYAELHAKYEATAKVLKELQSSIPNNTTTSVPCPESGQCTREVCWPLFIGEELLYQHEDHRITLSVNLQRLDKVNWQTTLSYHIHPLLKLTLFEITNTKTGHKDMQAKLVEVDEAGNELQPVKITKFEYVTKDDSRPGMIWWGPSLKLGIHQPLFAQNSWYPRAFLAVSFSKWGIPGDVGLWHFFQLGIGTGAKSPIFFIATPVSYNLGSVLPLISDLWIGIDVTIDIGARCTVGFSISTSL